MQTYQYATVTLPYLRPELISSSSLAQHDCRELEENGEPGWKLRQGTGI